MTASRTPEFIALLRKFAMPVVFTDHAKYPNIADLTGDFALRAPATRQGQDSNGLPAERHRRLGETPAIMGGRKSARRFAARRNKETQSCAARRVCLCHP
jgi:nicotinamidase-related amidase